MVCNFDGIIIIDCSNVISETNFHLLLANANRHRPHLIASIAVSLSMGVQSRCYVTQFSLDVDFGVPQSLSNGTGPLEHFLLKGAVVPDFVPHAGSPTDHIHSRDMRIERVGQTPILILEVIIALQASEADVEVC